MKWYGYMLKTVNISKDGKFGLDNNFKYPLKKGTKVVANDWNKNPIYPGGILGLIHDTKYHYIHDNPLWLILKYKKGTEIVVEDEKIKVPYVWIEAWGNRGKIQSLFKELTGKEYQYDYAIQTTSTLGIQIAGNESTQTACSESTQTAGYYSTQTAGNKSNQTASNVSMQKAGNESKQIAGNYSTQTAGHKSIQIAGYYSTQVAWGESTQTANIGSISIIRGQTGYCKHNGEVLQVLSFCDPNNEKHIFLTKIINDKKKHKLEAVNEQGTWILKDTIIEEEK